MLITTEDLRIICCKGGQIVFTNLNIRTDKAVETQVEAIFNEFGLNMTTAVNLFLRTIIRENGIPFRLQLGQPSTTTAAVIAGDRAMLDNLNAPRYSSMEALRAVLEVRNTASSFTTQFKKDLKLTKKQHRNLEEVFAVINRLANGETLEAKYQDHELSGRYKGTRECHTEPDWLLIYEIHRNTLVLIVYRVGVHSEPFKA